MNYKLDNILTDYYDKFNELSELNKGVSESEEMLTTTQELNKYEESISEIKKNISELQSKKEKELDSLSKTTSDMIDNMIDNNKKKSIEIKYDSEIEELNKKLNTKLKEYEEIKESQKSKVHDKYNTPEIANCKLELVNIIKSKNVQLKEELERIDIQKSGLINVCQRIVKAPSTLDETCIEFIESQIEELKFCIDNETDLNKKNEYTKFIESLTNIINKINSNESLNDDDKNILINQIELLDEYSKRIYNYVDIFEIIKYVDLNQEKKNIDKTNTSVENNIEDSKKEENNIEVNIINEEKKDENKLESTSDTEIKNNGYVFNSELESIDFMLKDILKEVENIDSLYLNENGNDSVLDDGNKKSNIKLDGIVLPSGEYINYEMLDDAIDRYYQKNKGNTYFIKERKFILNKTKAYQITPESIENLKEVLKNRSAIKLVNDKKIDGNLSKKIYGREAKKEVDYSTDEYEVDEVKEKEIGEIESNKEGKYISKKQLGYYLSEIFERRGPAWIEKLKLKFSSDKTYENEGAIKVKKK